jgi:hypothetical protein
LIRGWASTHAAAHDGARLEEVLDAGNTASDVWAVRLAQRAGCARIGTGCPTTWPFPPRSAIRAANLVQRCHTASPPPGISAVRMRREPELLEVSSP